MVTVYFSGDNDSIGKPFEKGRGVDEVFQNMGGVG